MADTTPKSNENIKNPNLGTPESLKSAKELNKLAAETLGIFVNQDTYLQNQVKSLDKQIKNFDKVAAKLSAINKSQLNTKNLEKDIQQIEEKKFLTTKNLVDLEKEQIKFIQKDKDLQSEINQLKVLRDKIDKNTKDPFSKEKLENYRKLIREKTAESIFLKRDIESNKTQYALTVKEQELQDKIKSALEEQRSIEEGISKQIGISGGAAQLFAKKLGIGSTTADKMFEAMVEGSRNADGSLKKLSKFETLKLGLSAIKKDFKEKLNDPIVKAGLVAAGLSLAFKGIGKVGNLVGSTIGNAGKMMGGLSQNSTGVITNLTSGFSGMLKSLPLAGGLIGGIVDGLSGVADLLLGANDQIIKAGRNLGLSRGEAEKLAHHFQDVSFSNNDIFVTSQKLLETQGSIGSQLGINNQLSDEQLTTLTKLKDIAGIDEQTQASIAESSTITGKTVEETTQAVLAQVVGLQKATGISLNQKQILKEASTLGGYLGLSFAKYPGQLSKALVTAKSFGLELKQLDAIADSFLDFESSISNEFEAQLLTGKDINLTKAREAFLNNDLATAAGEISSQVGSAADFMKMNRIQAESLAKSMGMSRDQLGDMLKKQEMLAKIGAKETDSSAKQFELAKKKYATQKEFNAALGEEAFQNMQNASTQEKIAAYMDKLKNSIVDFVERSKLIDKIESFINYLAEPKNMQGVLNTIKGVIASAIEFFGGVAENVAKLISHMPFTDTQKWQNIADKISEGTNTAASSVRSVGGSPSIGVSSVSDRTSRAAAMAGISNLPTNIPKEGNQAPQQNINLKIEQKPGNKPGEILFRIINEDGGAVLYDWQSGVYGLTKK